DLDLETAVSNVTYRVGEVSYKREVFSSAADQVLVVRLTASKPGRLSFRVNLARPGNKATVETSGNQITMYEHVGDGNGVKMVARVSVQAEGGTITMLENKLAVSDADAVTVLLSAATDY